MMASSSDEEIEFQKTNGIGNGGGRGGGEESTSSQHDTMATKTLLDMGDSSEDDSSMDELLRPAVRWSKHHQQRSERCMAVLTIASLFLLIVVAILIGLVCSSASKPGDDLCTTPECIQISSSILGAMNLSANPCDDFYEYTCGTWRANADLPDGYSRWGAFSEVDIANKHVLRKLLEKKNETYKGKSSTSVRKALDFYAACMDREHIEDVGVEPLLKFIKEDLGGWSLLASAKWDDSKEWDITDEVIKAHLHFSSSLFSMWISPDDKNSSTYIMQFQQAGLGLGPPDVYLDKEEDLERAYEKLGADIATYLSLEDEEDETETPEKKIFDAAKERMEAVLKWEKELAEIFVPKDQLLDPVTTYHKMTLKEFADLIPKINMIKFMEAIMGEKVPETEKVVVYTPSYFKKLNDKLKKVNMRDLLDYMRWGAIKPMLKELNQAVIEILLQYQKVSDGTDTEAAKWQKCVSRTGSTLGFATGALFVQEKVTPEMKKQTDAMIKHITDAFLDNLKGLKWMDDETKKRAEEKAKAVIPMVGYPDWLEDPKKLDKYYEKMEITKDDSFRNNLNTMKFYTNKNLKRWKQPVDRNEWEMSPAEVNAYYTPSFNQIVFPTGVLQQPFYNFNAPPAVNYGAIGVVMGHELTHGFDTQGRKYDKHGNMFDWWLNATAEAYQDKAQCVIDQYSKYKLGDLNINGKLTIGENIADNSGSTIAMQAFQAWDKDHPDEKKIAGLDFTKEQLFYVGFGRVWCDIETEESRKMRVYADVHSNPKYRVIGVVSNSEDFAMAFKCQKNSPMNPDKKCKVF